MLYAVVKILRAIKILRIENSTSDMPRTWNLDNFRSCMCFVFIRFHGLLIQFLCITLLPDVDLGIRVLKPYFFNGKNGVSTLQHTIPFLWKEESLSMEKRENL